MAEQGHILVTWGQAADHSPTLKTSHCCWKPLTETVPGAATYGLFSYLFIPGIKMGNSPHFEKHLVQTSLHLCTGSLQNSVRQSALYLSTTKGYSSVVPTVKLEWRLFICEGQTNPAASTVVSSLTFGWTERTSFWSARTFLFKIYKCAWPGLDQVKHNSLTQGSLKNSLHTMPRSMTGLQSDSPQSRSHFT